MGISEQGFRKLLKRFRQKRDGAVVHGLRGRCSNRRLKLETAASALEALKLHYSDFGPTLTAEYLEKHLKIKLSRETLRRLLIGEERLEAKPRKGREAHVWWPQRSCPGELEQWDTSIHAWLEERGPAKMYLIAVIDDATSRLFTRFTGQAAQAIDAHRPVGATLAGKCFEPRLDAPGDQRSYGGMEGRAVANPERSGVSGPAAVDDPNRGTAQWRSDGAHSLGIHRVGPVQGARKARAEIYKACAALRKTTGPKPMDGTFHGQKQSGKERAAAGG